ncbi:MAG TPA: hypothetical protein VGM06_09635 [Polyangiaceae bacterium]
MNGRALAAASLAIACLAPGVASADPPGDAVRAETLFRSAKQIRDAGWYADACPLFAQSNELSHGVGVSMYLADCDEHLGRTATAWSAFREAEKLARMRGDPRADLARARAEALARRLSGLTIVVPSTAKETDLFLDGAGLPRDSWNVPLAVDPGDHTIAVTTHGHAGRVLIAHVCAGDRNARLVVDDAASPGPAAAPPPIPAPATASVASPAAAPRPSSGLAPAPPPASGPAAPPPPPKVESDPRRWLGVGLLTAGAGGVVAGVALFLSGNQGGGTNAPPASQNESVNTGAAVALIAGGALIAAGLSFTVAASTKSRVGLLAAPVLMAGGGGAVLQGGF